MEKEIRQLEERIKELGLETTIINDVVNIYIPSYFKGIKTTYGRLKYKINDEESIKNALNELKKISLPMILEERIENLGEFLNAAYEFEQSSDDRSLEAFLSSITLVSDIDIAGEIGESVVLMTLHSAKGLEFPVVFMVGMEEGLFPSYNSFDNYEDLEEERRLCYVGITRSKEKLYLTYARQRNLYGRSSYTSCSRFIREIPQHLLIKYGEKSSKPDNAAVKTFSETYNKSFSLGDKVEHKIWGIGTIVKVEGEEITVAFPSVGIKKLDLKFAPIKAIS